MKISIITVSYNSEKFIEDCINSLLNQSYKNIEYIIVDGLSSDNTFKIVKQYSDFISVIVHEPDKGIYDAMNKGLKVSTGDVVGFLHSDDMYANQDVISKVVNLFKSDPELDACYGDLNYVKREDVSKVVRYWKSCKYEKGLFSKGWTPPHPTVFIKRKIYEYYGNFNTYYPIISDVELMMRFFEVKKIKTKYLNETLVKMRLGGKSNKSLRSVLYQNFDILNALKKNGLESNPIIFFINKIISRTKQYIQKQ